MNKSILAAAALALSTLPGSVGAGGLLGTHSVSALGVVIASQGNAALVHIKREWKQSALKTIEPFLPEPNDSNESSDAEEPAETPVAQRLL